MLRRVVLQRMYENSKLLPGELGIFHDHVISVARAKVFIGGEDARYDHLLAGGSTLVAGYNQVVGLIGRTPGAVLNMQPVRAHNIGRKFYDLATDLDGFFIQLWCLTKELSNGVNVVS